MNIQTERLELSPTCYFEVMRYAGTNITDVCLEYVERSSDHWNSDHTTSIALSEEDARKIMMFLLAAFGPGVHS